MENVPCALCGKNQADIICTKFNLFISRCVNCGLVFASPRLSKPEIWKRYSPEYFWQEYLPSLGVRDRKFNLDLFYARYAPILSLLASYIQTPGRLLEVGAGAGFFIKAAEHAGWSVSGVEISETAVQFGCRELGLDLKQGAAEELNFPTGFFDVVVMFETIEHLLDPRRVLSSVRRALREDGILVVSTPNLNALSYLLLGTDWAVLSPAEHLYYFTELTLRKILEQTGFREVKIHRQFEGFGIFETINPRYTHSPNSLRANAILFLVTSLGPFLFRLIQSWGKGDTLLCIARVGERTPFVC